MDVLKSNSDFGDLETLDTSYLWNYNPLKFTASAAPFLGRIFVTLFWTLSVESR
jgi:hypothetical protein